MSSPALTPTPTNTSSSHERRRPSHLEDDHELDDHRNQPFSLPLRDGLDGSDLARVNSNSSRRSIYRQESSRKPRGRHYSFGEEGLRRARSAASCAVSEVSGDGILLSPRDARTSERRRSIRTSTISDDDEDNDSRRSLSEDTDEDVCFPMVEKEQEAGIDFEQLDEFTENARQLARINTVQVVDLDEQEAEKNTLLSPRLSHEPKTRIESADSEATALSLPGATMYNPGESSSGNSDETKSVGDKDEDDFTENYLSPDLRARNPEVSFGQSRVEPDLQEEEVPLRFSFFGTETVETIHSSDLPSLVDEGQSFQDLFDSKNGIWWLDCNSPTDAEMKTLSKAFGIHPLTTEDIRTQESREKVELFKKYYFVSFHTFEDDPEHEDYLEPINFYIIVFREGILSFHFSPIPNCANVRRRIRQLRDYVKVTADWISYALIDDITDCFGPIIYEVQSEADVIEDSVFVARQDDISSILRRISITRKKTMTLLRLLSGKADVIKMFSKRCNEHWDSAPNSEIGLYLGDIQDHIVTMYQNLTVYEKIMSRSQANYLAQLQVESVAANNRVTSLLGKATMLGTILVPMNLITGMFGMNVTVPGFNQGNLRWFFGILGMMILLITVLVFIASRYLKSLERQNSAEQGSESSGASVFSLRTSGRLQNFRRGSRSIA